ncbi:hypothetical protein ACHQM5_013848 [Ranunculus cassubicifolius]
MESFQRYQSQTYAPSAPALPENHQQHEEEETQPCFSPPKQPPLQPSYSQSSSHPEIIRSFQLVDKDQSGFIDEKELQEALSFNYQKFSLRTVQLLMYLFKNPSEESLRIGPMEFSALWICLGQWRAIFERFDRDRSGKIDTIELRDALYSIGYAVPPSVLQVLISKYEDGNGRRGELNFDSFVECGMIIKGLTEKFKEKDPRYTGSATLNYETFLSMVIPFIPFCYRTITAVCYLDSILFVHKGWKRKLSYGLRNITVVRHKLYQLLVFFPLLL